LHQFRVASPPHVYITSFEAIPALVAQAIIEGRK